MEVEPAAEALTCFVIMPLTTRSDQATLYNDPDHFLHVLDHLVSPAIDAAGLRLLSPVTEGSDLIHDEIIRNLCEADLVLCDMSGLNANVFFEWGIRTAINKPVCVIADSLTANVPFDVGLLNYHQYNPALTPWSLVEQIPLLTTHILRTLEKSPDGTNILWAKLGIQGRATSYQQSEQHLADTVAILQEQVESLQADRFTTATVTNITNISGNNEVPPYEATSLLSEVFRPGVVLKAEQVGNLKTIALLLQRPNSSEMAALQNRAQRLGWSVSVEENSTDPKFTFASLDEV